MDLDLSVVLALSVSLWMKNLKFEKDMLKLYHWKKGLKGSRTNCSVSWWYSGSQPNCSPDLICVIVAKYI